jgi:hypothetical protein
MERNDWIEQLIHGVTSNLPEGWQAVEPSFSSGIDLVLASPDHNLFPIEVKSVAADLDISSVVQFGYAASEYLGFSDALQNATTLGLEDAEYAVKPILVSLTELPPASREYADLLHIDTVSIDPLQSAVVGPTGQVLFGNEILDYVTGLNEAITSKRELPTTDDVDWILKRFG